MSPEGLREGNRVQCRGCDLGTLHNGGRPAVQSKSRLLGSLICSRCRRHADRLIRKTICVSCYNREREVMVGRNSKGAAPIHCVRPFPAVIAFLVAEETTMQVSRFDRVTSQSEAVLSLLRREDRTVSFGWVGRPVLAA